MKYFLGYCKNPGTASSYYYPINIDGVQTSILSVVEFTCNFESTTALKKHLWENGYIKTPNVYLNYVIEKGPKDSKKYLPLKNTSRIYLKDSKNFFQIPYLHNEISSMVRNPDFVVFLYANYIRKMGLEKKASDFLKRIVTNKPLLLETLSQMSNILTSLDTQTALQNLTNYYKDNQDNIDYYEYESLVDKLFSKIANDDSITVNMIVYFRKYIDTTKIPCLRFLSEWLSYVLKGDNIFDSEFDPDQSYGAEKYKNLFFDERVYSFDTKTNTIILKNGKKKINERNLFDLAVIVEDYNRQLYRDYINAITPQVQVNSSITTIEEPDEYEEFLEEEDFARIGTTSEEAGIKLHP